MKCEVFWKDNDQKIHNDYDKEATHLSIITPLDDDSGLTPNIFIVCEAHADLGATHGWTKIHHNVARHIGQREEVLRKGP